MSIEQSKLPYRYDEMQPFLSSQNLMLHHGKLQKQQYDRLNELIDNTVFSDKNLTEIVKTSEGELFLHAAEIWNHNFFWKCLKPKSCNQPILPNPDLLKAIESNFGSFDEFKKLFKASALSSHGSGWTWLLKEASGKLVIINTNVITTPILDVNTFPLLNIDVWEHAYYIDYHECRKQYLENFWNVVNWNFVSKNYAQKVPQQYNF